jgi:hypothetical protein
MGQLDGSTISLYNRIQFRPRFRGVKKIGLFFREETSTVQPERSGGRLLVLGKMIRFLASGMQPAAFLFGSVSLSAVRKRNEHHAAGPCEREMNSPIQEKKRVQSNQGLNP